MKEMDDIEQLFASSFDGAEVTPPVKVKTAVDKALFGGNKIIGLRLISLLILALLVGLGIFFIPNLSPANSNQQSDLAKHNISNQLMEANHHSMITDTELKNEGIINNTAINSNNEESESTINSTQKYNSSKKHIETSLKSTISTKEKNLVDKLKDKSSSKINLSNNNSKDNTKLVTTIPNSSKALIILSDESESFETVTTGLQTKEVESFSSKPNGLIKGSYPTLASAPIASGISLSLYSGVTGAANQLNPTITTLAASNLSVKELNGYTFAIEASNQMFGQFGIATGVQYSTRNDYLIDAVSVTDSSIVGGQWEYVYNNPQTQDSIIDSNYVNLYNVAVNTIENESIIQSVAISIPIYFTYEKAIGNHLSLRVSAGARFSYLKLKTLNDNVFVPSPTYSKFGLSLLLRPELRYDFSRFGIGLYGTTGYNAITGMNWETHNRHRYEFGGGLVLRFKL